MKRRSHKKSRGGCLECRRRHIKCDETQGACINCITAERHCEYRGQSAPVITNQIDDDASSAGTLAQTPSFMADLGDPAVNMNHMELLIHFSPKAAFPEMERGDFRPGTDLMLKMSLEAPYLLHQVLAISARHLSVLRPSQSAFYLHQATQLQTRSISIFKASQLLINSSTCVPMVFYSSLLGRHLLADVLANRNPELSSFLDNFIQYVRLHRGVKVIASGNWHLLIASDLLPFIRWGTPPPELTGRGCECSELRRLVLEQSHLDETSLKACQDVIELLQVGFDELNNPHEERSPYSLIFTWIILSPEEFFYLLERRQPEAIAILGYYAALLHRGQHIWQIADSGARLFCSISQHLGPAFAPWLSWPQEVISCL
ncbi:hypothetical protein F5X99DRAFT_376684 [Biscogniauxia marginata]|nr:hypothetical protein F5X99DRAFT_376684 [Biscogniauxia marginata]